MTVAAVSAAVIVRIGSARLIQITNDDGAATTIDNAVLDAASSDAIGTFERITGIAETTGDPNPIAFHTATLVSGAMANLEDWKARSSGIITNHVKQFIAACQDARERVYQLARSNSPLVPSKQRQGARPDMDRKRSAFNPSDRRAFSIEESIDTNNP